MTSRNASNLTESMKVALEICDDKGVVYSGYNPGSGRPSYRVSASVIRGLERRGLVKVSVESGGSLAAVRTRSPEVVDDTAVGVSSSTLGPYVAHLLNEDDPCIVAGCKRRYGHNGDHDYDNAR